jgi:hypothetical protein
VGVTPAMKGGIRVAHFRCDPGSFLLLSILGAFFDHIDECSISCYPETTISDIFFQAPADSDLGRQ